MKPKYITLTLEVKGLRNTTDGEDWAISALEHLTDTFNDDNSIKGTWFKLLDKNRKDRSTMNCPRCSAMMLIEALRERDTNDLGTTISLSRCPMCGFYTDALMEANRKNPSPEGTRDRYAAGSLDISPMGSKDAKARQYLYNRKMSARRGGNALKGLFDDL